MSINDFRRLDAAGLIINIWTYANAGSKHTTACEICQRYSNLSIQALAEKWEEKWGDMEYLVKKIIENDRKYINIINRYSASTKNQILDFIEKYNKKN